MLYVIFVLLEGGVISAFSSSVYVEMPSKRGDAFLAHRHLGAFIHLQNPASAQQRHALGCLLAGKFWAEGSCRHQHHGLHAHLHAAELRGASGV